MFVGARIILSEPAKILGICKGSVCGVGDLHLYHVGSKAAALLASIFLLLTINIYNNNNSKKKKK